MSSRPTKILKISAFRDFFVTVPKCQKEAKNRVKTRFLRRISILCSSYGGSDGNLNRNVRFRQCVAFRRTVAHSFRRLSMAVRPSFSAAEWVRYLQKVPPQRRGSALCTDPLLCVPLTQSGYFRQNSMAGVNPCRGSRCGIYKCYCPPNCSVICLKKFADHRSREALSRMKLRTSSLAEA